MPTQTPTYELEIPAHQIANAEAFEASRAGAYAADSLAERQATLEELLQNGKVVGGVVLSDVLLERLTNAEEHAERAKTRLEEISDRIVSDSVSAKHEAEAYKFTLDGNGNVVDILHVVPIAEDRAATSRNRRTANSIGWGPKQNNVSGIFGVPKQQGKKNKRNR